MLIIYNLLAVIIDLYTFALIASAILSWLVAFNVVNTQNRFIYMVGDSLYRLTEPALGPIRRVMPNLGGIDISPIIVILLLQYLIKPVLAAILL